MSNYRTDVLDRSAEAFRALANPHRLRIFLRLAACCGEGCSVPADVLPRCVGDVGGDLGLAPSTVSHHCKELRRSGLIVMERRGRTVECRVDPARLRELAALLDPSTPAPTTPPGDTR